MPLKLANYKSKAQKAIQTFWSTRDSAKQKQIKSGKSDHGERASVTGGKNMDGFISLIIDVVKANGLKGAQFHVARSVLTLPGFYRPTKLWDLLIFNNGKLIAAIELKSQVGPSFGNNFNNRAEEAIGTAHDFWTAYREGALGKNHPRPFVGWIMLVEDDQKSREPVKVASPHFKVFQEFEGASYLDRYSVLCQKLMQENLYTNACLLASPQTSSKNGSFRSLSEMTSLRNFVTSLAGHIATESANSRS